MSKDQALASASSPRSTSTVSVLSLASILYFSEGLPYGIVTEFFPLYMRLQHAQLVAIGMLNAVAAAWTFKVLWSPLVDLYGTYRRWITGALAGLTVSMLMLAAAPSSLGAGFWVILTLLTLASATQDIAVDAFTIRTTPKDLVGPVNSVRLAAYRAGIIVGGGGLAAFGSRFGWRNAFLAGALLTAALLVFTTRIPKARGNTQVRLDLAGGLKQWLRRPAARTLLLIVFLYKLGEFAIASMVKPFWLDRGYSVVEIATVTTVLGVTLTLAGALAGGVVVARIGVYRALLWLGLAQIVSNLGYAFVSTFDGGRTAMYVAAVLENFALGLGTAAFLALLMLICDREHAATEFALLTATYGLARTAGGILSGYVSQYFGFTAFFWVTVALGIPALLLLPLVRSEVADAENERLEEALPA
jgi:PAT family beta-lactamase induction signal transducer AmpG